MIDKFSVAPQEPTCSNPTIRYDDRKNSIFVTEDFDNESTNAQVRTIDFEGNVFGRDTPIDFKGNIRNVDIAIQYKKIYPVYDDVTDTFNNVEVVNPILYKTGWYNCDHWMSGGVFEDKSTFRSVLTHEMGHALGLMHHWDDFHGLMRTPAITEYDEAPLFCSVVDVKPFADDSMGGRHLYNSGNNDHSISVLPYRVVTSDVQLVEQTAAAHQIVGINVGFERLYVSPFITSIPIIRCPGQSVDIEVSTQNLGTETMYYDRNIFIADADLLYLRSGLTYTNKNTIKTFTNRVKSPSPHEWSDVISVKIPNNQPLGDYVLGTEIYNVSPSEFISNDNIGHNLTPVTIENCN